MSFGKEILLISAEASSNLYALRLLKFFKQNFPDVSFFGIGNREMESLGFQCLGRSEEMAVVGAIEILENLSLIRKTFHSLVEEARRRRPKVVVLMDYPDFNLRLAKEMKDLGIPVVYYISPQVWAWRKGRVHLIKKLCDRVLVLFPFERDFYQSFQVPCDFVGHPILDELKDHQLSAEQIKVARGRRGFKPEDRIVGLMPGSRKGELDRHLQTQIAVAEKLSQEDPRIKIAFLVAPTFDKQKFIERIGDVSFSYIVLQDEPFSMIQICDVLLVASGTATLQVGLCEKPMVIMYKMKWASWGLAKIFVRGVKFFGLVNVIFNEEVVPELFQHEASVERISRELKILLAQGDEATKMKARLATLRHQLGDALVTERVAKILQGYLI